jgi:SAM-dependent methyltransferase
MLTAQLDRLALKPGDNVLDLGCGEGRHVHALHTLGYVNVVGVDRDEPSLEKAREALDDLPPRESSHDVVTELHVADALELPFESNSFDVVICSEVLEHIEAFEDVLSEIRRVLKPHGRLCVSVPRAWPERLCWQLAPAPDGYPFDSGGHIRIFNALALRRAIQSKGFAFAGKHHAHALHAPFWWLKCLFWQRRDDHPLVEAYHSFLVWDLLKRPVLTRALEAFLNPIMGKSLVLYFGPEEAA